MAVTLYHVGRSPVQTQFGLDTFTEHYKANEAADAVITGDTTPDTQMAAVHPDYPFMFVTGRYCAETGPSASALDVTYTGCMRSSEGEPALPSQQSEDSFAVQTATSGKGIDGTLLAGPITVEFYAPTKRLKFITYGSRGDLGTVGDPSDSIVIIKLTIGDTSYAATGAIPAIVANFFTQQIVDTMSSPEIVAGHFWENSEIKTKTLTPWIYTATSGEYLILYAPGSGYTVGNSITINDGMGHSANITVDAVGIGNSIVDFHATANTFDYTTDTPLFASGGSGSGAGFYNYHIP